jgi:hypothetical protein
LDSFHAFGMCSSRNKEIEIAAYDCMETTIYNVTGYGDNVECILLRFQGTRPLGTGSRLNVYGNGNGKGNGFISDKLRTCSRIVRIYLN